MAFRQDCGTFSSFSIKFPPKNAQEEFHSKKKKTTPVTTLPELPGLLDRWAYLIVLENKCSLISLT